MNTAYSTVYQDYTDSELIEAFLDLHYIRSAYHAAARNCLIGAEDTMLRRMLDRVDRVSKYIEIVETEIDYRQ